MGGLVGPEYNTHYFFSHPIGSWKNLINVYASKRRRTWILVKLAVSDTFDLKNTNSFFIWKYYFIYMLGQCFKRTIKVVGNLAD